MNAIHQAPGNGNLYDQNNNAAFQLNPIQIDEMPECAERLILELICHYKNPPVSIDDVNTILTNIKNKLEVEGLLSKQVQNLLSGVTSNISANLIVEKLEQLIACIRDIDIHRLKRLTARNNDAIEVIRNKDVYLFIGLTGHGKSTTIHYLAGSQFQELRDSVNGEVAMFGPGRPHYVPVSCPSGLERVTTSPYPESDTNNIIPVVVNLPDGREVILCDAPGFEDTNGVEIDIANSIAIKNSIWACRAVKPIVVISKNMGERMIGLSQLARMLSRMINNVAQNVQQFTYVFTNYTQQDADLITSSIKDLTNTESFKNSTDEGYKILILNILDKLESSCPIIIDLNNPARREHVIQKTINRTIIMNPKQFFKLSLGLRSQKAVGDQIDRHITAIRKALERSDQELADYKMGDLMYLQELFDGMEIFKKKFEDIKSIFDEYFNNRSFRMWSEDHRLTIDDLDAFRSALQEAQRMHRFKRMLFRDDHSFESLKDDCIDYVNRMAILNDSSLFKTKLHNLRLLDTYFTTSPFSCHFSEIVSAKNKDAHSNLRSILMEKVESCHEIINLNPPESIGEKLFDLFSFSQNYSDFLVEEGQQPPYVSVFNTLKETVTQKLEESINNMNSFRTLDSNQKYMSYLLEDLRSYNLFRSPDQDLMNWFNQNHRQLLDSVISRFNSLDVSSANLQEEFRQLQSLRENEEIARATEKRFQDIKFRIESEILHALNSINEQVRVSPDGALPIDTERVKMSVESLKRLIWVDELMAHRPCGNCLNEIESNFIKNISYLKEVIEFIDLSEYSRRVPENDDKLDRVFHLARNIEAYRPLCNPTLFPRLENTIQTAMTTLENKFMNEFSDINRLFEGVNVSENRTDLRKAESCVNFLKKIDRYRNQFSNQLRQKHLEARQILENHLRERYNWINDNFDEQLAVLDSSSDEALVQKSASVIQLFMKQMEEISRNKGVLDDFGFNNLYNEKRHRLTEFFTDVERSMERYEIRINDRPDTLQRDLRKVKCLFVLNEFLGREPTAPSFRRLYHQYNLVLAEQTERALNEMTSLFNSRSFDQLAEKMSLFQGMNNQNVSFFFGLIKQKINVWLVSAVEEVTNMSNLAHDLEPNDLGKIKTLLTSIDQARTYLLEYIDQKTLLNVQETVKIIFIEIIDDYLSRLNSLLNSFDVEPFFKKLENALSQSRLLIELCGSDQNIKKKLANLADERNNLVHETIKRRFKDLDLEMYSSQPPTVILNKLANYPNECSFLKTLILEKYNQELEAASNCESFYDNEHYNKCMWNTIYLSRDLREDIERRIEDYKSQNLEEINQLKSRIEQLLSSGQCSQIASMYENAKADRGKNLKIIKTLVQNSFDTLRREMRQALDKCNSREIVAKFSLIASLKDTLPDLFKDVEIDRELRAFFRKNVDSFVHEMKIGKITCNIYETLESLSAVKTKDIEDMMNQLNDAIFEHILFSNSIFEAGLKEYDVEKVKNAMNSIHGFDSILYRVKPGSDLMSYEQMKDHLSNSVSDFKNGEKFFDLVVDSNMQEKDCDAYFVRIKKKQHFLVNLKRHFQDMFTELELGPTERDFVENLYATMKSIFVRADDLLDEILNQQTNSKSELKDFKVFTYYLNSYEKVMRRRIVNHKPVLEYFNDKIMDHIDSITELNMSNNLQKAADCFVATKKLANNLLMFGAKINEELEKMMQKYIKQIGFNNFGQLALKLCQSNEGRMIINEHGCFEGYQRSVFNEKTIRQDINYVLDATRGDSLDKQILREKYTEFNQLYERLVIDHLSESSLLEHVDQLTIKTIQFVQNIYIFEDSKGKICWDETIKARIPSLLAHMFALWTIMNSGGFFETTEGDMKTHLFKPHPAQVISVFRMLGIGYSDTIDNMLDSNLVQLGTGEGKSITLGITCALLALLGFDVHCVCYSQYLSDRDFNAFKSLFEILNVAQSIHYGTFKQICENFVNQRGNLRANIETFLKQNSIPESCQVSRDHRHKILLIDEVDVFFSKDFYGSSFNPVVALKSPAIDALVREIWANRINLSLETVKSFASYLSCITEFAEEWKRNLFDRFVEDMIDSLKTFVNHQYVVMDDKIGYIIQDGVDFNARFGYQTMFAYFKEHENGKISEQSLKANISMTVNLGNYSYAEVPKDFYAILGLSGTLESLSELYSNVIKDEYKIRLKTFIPSVYGDKKFVFNKNEKIDIVIEKKESYHKELVHHIQCRQSKYSEACKRPILIFFENKDKLMELYNSNEYKEFINDTAYLTEETLTEEKIPIIVNATSEGKKLLATRIFGRGTDFVVYDTKVRSNGGVHVIQTFLSEELSEEIQIKGRTARQGDEGSYSMFLLDSSLVKFNITAESLAQNKSRLYDHLNEKRNEYFSRKCSKSILNVNNIKERHWESKEFLNNLSIRNVKAVEEFLLQSLIYC